MKMKKRVTPLSTELFSDSDDSDNAKYVLCIFEMVNYRCLKCILKASSGKTVFPFRNNEVGGEAVPDMASESELKANGSEHHSPLRRNSFPLKIRFVCQRQHWAIFIGIAIGINARVLVDIAVRLDSGYFARFAAIAIEVGAS